MSNPKIPNFSAEHYDGGETQRLKNWGHMLGVSPRYPNETAEDFRRRVFLARGGVLNPPTTQLALYCVKCERYHPQVSYVTNTLNCEKCGTPNRAGTTCTTR